MCNVRWRTLPRRFRRRNQISCILIFGRIASVHMADGFQCDQPWNGSAVARIGLTRVRSQIGHCNAVQMQRIVGLNFVIDRLHWQYVVALPPGHVRQRIASGQTTHNSRLIQGYNVRFIVIANNVNVNRCRFFKRRTFLFLNQKAMQSMRGL